jgi:hypothetical protein
MKHALTLLYSFLLTLIVDTPDLSSTCIEFVGNLAGREVRVLLDSGASANFVSDNFVA